MRKFVALVFVVAFVYAYMISPEALVIGRVAFAVGFSAPCAAIAWFVWTLAAWKKRRERANGR